MIEIIYSIFYQAWILTTEMAPYLFLGFLIAGFIHVLLPVSTVAKHFGKEDASSVIKASLFGVPIPLCSCGVLPVAASLRKSGAGKAATLSFLLTTPVTGVDSLIATWGLMGGIFTICRLFASVVMGLAMGFAMLVFDRKETVKESSIKTEEDFCCSSSSVFEKIKESLHYSFIELPSGMSSSLLIGLLLGGVLSALLPPLFIEHYIGTGFMGLFVSVLIGIPVYVCATGSIPIAVTMVINGFSPGAALAFLIAGPASNTVSIATVNKLLGRRALVIYVSVIFLSSILFGWGLDQLISMFKLSPNLGIAHHMHEQGSNLPGTISAVFLLGLLVILPIYGKYKNSKKESCCEKSCCCNRSK